MSGYCAIAPGHPVHERYHATEYGFPSRDERVLFERLCLEIMQAGLSWETGAEAAGRHGARLRGFRGRSRRGVRGGGRRAPARRSRDHPQPS